MRNRLGTIAADADVSYRNRLRILRDRKIEDTKDKAGIRWFSDGDDYGAIAPPPEYKFEPYVNHPNGSFYGLDGWCKNFYRQMDSHPVFLDPVDAFPNRWMMNMTWVKPCRGVFCPECNYDYLRPMQQLYGIVPGIGADAHFGGDYAIGLQLGWGGLLDKIEEYRKKNPGNDAFYDAEVMTVDAVQQWMRHTSAAISKAIEGEANAELRKNLREMLKCNDYLVYGAPRTLREACHWICYFNMASREYNRDGAGCQLDEMLKPYYDRDKAAGILDDEEAKYYIACLLLNDPHYYQLGGLSPEGRDMTNEFSELCLEAADWLDSSCNITVRVHDNTSREFMKKAVGYLFKNKNGWPRFSGDGPLSRGFMKKGYPVEIARQRVAVGCHWMSLPGLEYTLNDCVKINNLKVFSVAFDEMMQDGGEKSTARLFEIYKKHQRKAVEITAEGILFHLDNQIKNEPELMLNLISHGPIERGKDISNGGAIYYNMCIDGTGIATVSDSFTALEQRVEKEGRVTFERVYEAMKANWAGPENEYIRLMMHSSERYGAGGAGDEWGKRITESFTADVNDMDNMRPPVKFIPGWFSWSNTIALGKAVSATPNGRFDFEPINHGANPHPGFRKDGALTAMSNAICAVQPGCGNTAPIQLELDPGMARSEEGVEKIVDYIYTIFDLGATLLNINIINADQILEADKNPDLFPDLVVRVTGFTAYFCLLTPEFRKLVVDRILRAG